jgi:hypothetical protein
MDKREQEYNAYQEYLAFERQNIAPDLGKKALNAPAFGETILTSFVTLGTVDIPEANTEFREKPATNVFSREIGATALASSMTNELEIDFNDPKLVLGRAKQAARRDELALAA